MSGYSLLTSLFCITFALLAVKAKIDNSGSQTVIFEPEDQPVYTQTGMKFTLVCRFPDPDKKGITWYHESNVITIDVESGFDEYKKIREEDGNRVVYSTLSKANVEPNDGGAYECRPSGAGEGSGFITTVIVINVEPMNDTLVVGEDATLQCKVSGELYSRNDFRWYRAEDAETQLQPGDKYKMNDNNGTLTIIKADEHDAGKYICKFTLKNDNSMEQTVSLFSAPFVKNFEGKSKDLVEGDPLVLKCSVLSEPMPTITWLKKDQDSDEPAELIPIGGRVSVSEYEGLANATLRINDIEKEDRADYMCRAENEYGAHNSTVIVRVKDKLAALWPFLGICAEVVILCTIIFIYEKRRAKKMEEEDAPEETGHLTNSHDHKEKDDIRQRK